MKKASQGPAFSDFIGFEKSSRRRFIPDDRGHSQMRGFFLPVSILILFIVLFAKLVSLQLFEGRYYRTLSDKNRIRSEAVHAPRGIIFDRNGTPLVFNSPGYRQTVNGKTEIITAAGAMDLIAKGKKNIEIDSFRKYPYKDAFAHVIGYIGQISKDQFKMSDFSNYRIDDLIGKDGIEQEYEKKLKGIDGKKLIEVDAAGKTVRTLGQEDPIAGENITLTLDAKLQQKAFEAMQGVKKGALIVSGPKGEILVMISKPSFDPNLFTQDEHYEATSSAYKNVSEVLLDSDNQPLLNRAIAGVYPPGSTFKIITAATGLENKIIDENYQIEDTGVITVGAFSFANWYFTQYGGKEGMVNIVKAIKRSNDIFFYKLAEKVGVEKLSEMAKKFGLGQKEGIDLEGEATGLVPSNDWKKKAMGESWYLGDTYHYGIGQGYLLTTPLQVNSWTQVIANGGSLYQPRLNTTNTTNNPIRKNFISEKTVSLIQQGMVQSCSTGGVAWPLFEFKVKNSKLKVDGKNFLDAPQSTISADFKDYRKVSIVCKTGTAQHGDINTMPHAWITLFAPAYDPQIVVTVLSESSGEGSNVAAPIAKKVLEEWFTR
ncbi:MAG: penicillin-binding transpeptidase domain-containing protein [Candidatus Levybacteria bacterium]|nr:penicillin-binding transpeptidase domain-containing protein [Candidatus Levybacteria bacterium]